MEPKQIAFYEALGEKGKHLLTDKAIIIPCRKMKRNGKYNQNPVNKTPPTACPRANAWSGHIAQK